MIELYRECVYKASKEHKCEICGRTIKIGESYSRESGKFNGEFFDRCLDTTCAKIIETYISECSPYGEYWVDEVVDWLIDKYCYDCKEREDCDLFILQCPKMRKEFEGGEK